MIDERKLLFYRKISLSNNVILRTFMCLLGVSSEYIFCAVSMVVGHVLGLLQPEINDAVSHAFMASFGAYLQFLLCMIFMCFVCLYFVVLP